eukprot:gene28220-37225_t
MTPFPENEFIDFFQKAPIALHWLSGTGHILWANDVELETMGYTAEEYIGHSIAEFCPDETEQLQDVFGKLSRGENIKNASFKFRTKHNKSIYLTVDSNVSWNSDVENSEMAAQHVFNQGTTQQGNDESPKRFKTNKYRVLVVDDSVICQKVLVKALNVVGIDTDTASNGKEACEKLSTEPCIYDAVLMDLRMPIMDGITATRVCKGYKHLANVPIIIVTAEFGEEIKEAAMNAHATSFINKPANMQELRQLLFKLLAE